MNGTSTYVGGGDGERGDMGCKIRSPFRPLQPIFYQSLVAETLWVGHLGFDMHSGAVVVLRFQHWIFSVAVWLSGIDAPGHPDCVVVGHGLDAANDVVWVGEAGDGCGSCCGRGSDACFERRLRGLSI